ncbi:hypothetical protein ACHHYP_00628 [Achlya hypogyna]|uniref:Uncharacterized protein n=1 Tax=Achlya hypogyna TaxID=1202772 RepID=A0A1V9ZAH4_ACHHY|nr:hypothetical protein ACHHYP_00628 [Achlya hypogyna]
MNAFIGSVFDVRDTVSFAQAVPTRWMVWLRPTVDAIVLTACVGSPLKCFEKNLRVPELTVHQMHELGVRGDLDMFAAPFKAALGSRTNVALSTESNGSVSVDITYLFGASLLRRGQFVFDAAEGQLMPEAAFALLLAVHGNTNESPDEAQTRRARRVALMQPVVTSVPLSFDTPAAPAESLAPAATSHPLKRKALPMGARRRAARGVKLVQSDDEA